jgi:hypothetical protein
MKQSQLSLCLLMILLLAACGPATSPLPPTATAAASPVKGCYFIWATQPLTVLSARIQKSIDEAGMKGSTAFAQAYGENCYDNATNQVVSFSAMETDVQVTVPVKNIQDSDDLGESLGRIITILDGLPAGSLSAGRLGTISITYQAGGTSMHLFFTDQDARTARGRGLHGAALIAALQNK